MFWKYQYWGLSRQWLLLGMESACYCRRNVTSVSQRPHQEVHKSTNMPSIRTSSATVSSILTPSCNLNIPPLTCPGVINRRPLSEGTPGFKAAGQYWLHLAPLLSNLSGATVLCSTTPKTSNWVPDMNHFRCMHADMCLRRHAPVRSCPLAHEPMYQVQASSTNDLPQSCGPRCRATFSGCDNIPTVLLPSSKFTTRYAVIREHYRSSKSILFKARRDLLFKGYYSPVRL